MAGAMVAGYRHQLAGHCGSGSMRDLLGWAGLSYTEKPLSEGFVFGLSGALAFTYLRGPGLGTPIYLVGRGPSLTEHLCDRVGVRAALRTTDDPEQGWLWVREELDAGQPVLCWAEMAELPYLRVRMRMSRHDIVVIGYDQEAGTATVIDNDRETPQTISLEALARARSAQGFPMPTRHACYQLRFPAKLPALTHTASAACAEAAANLLDGIGLPQAIPATVAASGLQGVQTFVEDLDSWADLFSSEELDRALHSVWAFIEKTGTGGSLFRRLQATYLDDLYALLPDPKIAEAADCFSQLAEQWSGVASAAKSDEPPEQRLKHVRRQAGMLPALEVDAAQRLSALAERGVSDEGA